MSSEFKPIRIGFVGLSAQGWAANALAPPLFLEPVKSLYSLKAVSTTNPNSAAESAKKYSETTGGAVKPYHGDTAQIASDADVDFVVVSVKTPAHADAVRPAIAAGKDVFVEWPLGKNLAESIELAEAAKAKGVRTLIGLQAWQSPIVTKAREAIAAGKIGRIHSATWIAKRSSDQNVWAPKHVARMEWALDPANGTHYLHILIGHNLSAITRILGPLETINATATTTFETIEVVDDAGKTTHTVPSASPDNWAFSGPLKDHKGALFNGVFTSGGVQDPTRPTFVFLIDGDKGSIVVESYGTNGSFINLVSPEKLIINGEEVKVEDVPHGNIQRNWEAFANKDEGNYPTFDDAVVNYKHVDAIATSVRESRRVVLDL